MSQPTNHPLHEAFNKESSSTRVSKGSHSEKKSRTSLERTRKRKSDTRHGERSTSKRSSRENDQSHVTPNSQSQTTIPSQATSNPLANSTPVSNVWVPGGISNAQEADKEKIKVYVSKELWHYEKFITDRETQLKYDVTNPKTICYHVLKGCLLSLTVDRSHWWNTKVKNWVYRYITSLRNSKMTALKLAFFGK